MASEREEHPSEFDGHTSRIRCQRRSENHAREEDIDLRAALELMKEERARLQQKLEAMLTTQIQNDKQQEELERRHQDLETRMKAEQQINAQQQLQQQRINAKQLQQFQQLQQLHQQKIHTQKQLQKKLQTAMQQAPGYVSDNNEQTLGIL